MMAPPATQPRLLLPFLGPVYARFEPVAYAILRIGYGLTLATHGIPKLLGTSHGSMADPVAGSIRLIRDVMGLPFATELALLVTLLEGIGGLLLAAGLATRILAAAFVVEMVGICFALGPTYPWIDRGIEYPIVLGLIGLYVSGRGGGAWSADRVIGKEV